MPWPSPVIVWAAWCFNIWASAQDRKPGHPDHVPQPASFILAGHVRRHGHISVINGAGQEQREFDSRLLRGLGHVNLHAIGESGERCGRKRADTSCKARAQVSAR